MIEKTKAHGAVVFGVVARWARGNKHVVSFAAKNSVYAGNSSAYGTQSGLMAGG
jgi:hypothetical protein